jgi:4,5-dihydroxyphthalate decarboxylase
MAELVKIKLASRAYDGTLPILRGQIGIQGFHFEITETEDVPGMFAGMFKGQYDISEMSLGELIYYTSRGKADFVAIPIFPSRIFRHGFIFCRKASGVHQPSDLDGKKIGFLRWVQTAAIWMRGMLIDEYGVSARDTEWHVASMHHWDDDDPVPRSSRAMVRRFACCRIAVQPILNGLAARFSTVKLMRWG